MALCLLRPTPQPVPALAAPSGAAREALQAGQELGFDQRRAAALFAALGVPMARSVSVPEVRKVASAVDEIGGPVALKILSADIAHKTEAGGVALGLPDGQHAAVAAREIEKRVKAHTAPTPSSTASWCRRWSAGLPKLSSVSGATRWSGQRSRSG